MACPGGSKWTFSAVQRLDVASGFGQKASCVCNALHEPLKNKLGVKSERRRKGDTERPITPAIRHVMEPVALSEFYIDQLFSQ